MSQGENGKSRTWSFRLSFFFDDLLQRSQRPFTYLHFMDRVGKLGWFTRFWVQDSKEPWGWVWRRGCVPLHFCVFCDPKFLSWLCSITVLFPQGTAPFLLRSAFLRLHLKSHVYFWDPSLYKCSDLSGLFFWYFHIMMDFFFWECS